MVIHAALLVAVQPQMLCDAVTATEPLVLFSFIELDAGAILKVHDANVAVTVVSEFKTGAHAPVPEQPPSLQPVNTDPLSVVAARVTEAFSEYEAEQAEPQLILLSALVTVPLPEPDLLTVMVY
jgi:hypothetical protein